MAEIIREIVSELRGRRIEGTSAAALVRYLQALGISDMGVGEYLRKAFLLTRPPNINFLRRDSSGAFLGSALDNSFGPPIDAASAVWRAAEPYPDLIRRRDRHAFREVAREFDLVIFVHPANSFVERYVGTPGFRPCPPWLAGNARTAEPNAGLVAAVPEDGDLPRSSQSYAELRQQIEKSQFEIGPAADGYVIRDRAGTAFYTGYCLHGVFSISTGMNAWTVADGERIRASLNRRLGEELVQCGPYENWEQRSVSPRFPLLLFEEDQPGYVVWNAGALRAEYSFRKIQPHLLPVGGPPSADVGSR